MNEEQIQMLLGQVVFTVTAVEVQDIAMFSKLDR